MKKIFLSVLFSSLFYFALAGTKIAVRGLDYRSHKPVTVTVKNGIITRVKKHVRVLKSDSLYLSPGLIDNQVNGYAGVSFGFGNSDLNGEGIIKATRELWKAGVTTYLPTLTTHSREVMTRNLKILSGAMENPELLGSIAGFHLEGPYISAEDGYRGAHPKLYVRKPDWEEFTEMNLAAKGKILQVTLAPETEGAMEFIRKCAEKGIVVALGHHNASKEVVDEAVANGAGISTHLGNGCANMINRHKNPLWPQLANKNLTVTLICDGFHLLPEEIEVFYRVKGVSKTIITSDVTSYASLQPGIYTVQTGETIELTPEGRLYYPAQNVLYGSASAITKGVGNMIKITGCTLSDAITMASTNPAQMYHLTDRGSIKKGLRADLILFKFDKYKLSVKETFVNGKRVYKAP